MAEWQEIIEKGKSSHKLTHEEICCLLAEPACEEELARAADEVRHAYVGDGVHLRGLIEFSNYCRQNCAYCGLRRDNKNIKRYRLSAAEIVALARQAQAYGYKTVVLQSGEDEYFTLPRLRAILLSIKELDLAVTLSIGERSYAEYKALREAGADRFLLRIETTDAELYARHDPGMSHERRLRCLQDLKALGYEVGTGTLVGLPGQTIDMLARDILFYQQIDADMLGIGPLVPNPHTPLGDAAPGDWHLTRRFVAILRLLLPDSNIPATTAMDTLKPGGRDIMLRSGANVVMPNVTTGEARRNYALYPGKACVNDTPEHCRSCMSARIAAMGRFVAENKGFRQRRKI
ncbi:MAG: [Selenomonas sp.]|nr:[FeFe] hydrogenase H-cluster radical SAM maturase HydE [Selenomonas sp.]